MRKAIVLTAIGLTTLFATGCGSSDSSSTSDTSMAESTLNEFNDADVMFAQMMIPHHEQAIEMSDIALDPTVGASDEIRALAEDIKAAQDPEIAQMTAFLESWGQPVAMDSSMDHSSMMSGMLTVEEIETLGSLRGAEFDMAWLEAMIKHHESAIQMADDVLSSGVNADVKTLAEEIIATQQSEIDAMRTMLS
jgi:uncharacterized protein (DUF305 family)